MGWFQRKAERELEAELRFHVDSLTEDYERAGMSAEEARRKAYAEFGKIPAVQDHCRDERRFAWFAEFAQDLRYGLRMLAKAPVVTACAVLSLALGLGANTAIYSLLDEILWRPIAVPDAQQLAFVRWTAKAGTGLVEGICTSGRGSRWNDGPLDVGDFFSYSAFQTMQAQLAGKAELTGFLYEDAVTVGVGGKSLIANYRAVSGNFFDVLRVGARHGRPLRESDDRVGAPPVAVVSHKFWQQQLDADPKAVGRTVRVKNAMFQVVGILPQTFRGIDIVDDTGLYVPFRHAPTIEPTESPFLDAKKWWVELLVRWSDAISTSELQAALHAAFVASWDGKLKDPAAAPAVAVISGEQGLEGLRRSARKPLMVLMGLVVLVLLICCANIANLLLARSEGRRREISIRLSIGADRARLARQFFTESLMLAALGGLVSLVFALGASNALVKLLPYGQNAIPMEFHLDARLLLITLAGSLLTVLLFGLFPAWRATRFDASSGLKEGAGSLGSPRGSHWTIGKILVISQVALALALVSTATLFARSLTKIHAVDPGYDRRNVLLFGLRPGENGYDKQRQIQYFDQVEERLRHIPGIRGVGLTENRPLSQSGNWRDLLPEGESKTVSVAFARVSAGLLDALGVKLVAGRNFRPDEVRAGRKVAVVNEALAEKLGRGRQALGRRIFFGKTPTGEGMEVIGIVRNPIYSDLKEETPDVMYIPASEVQESMNFVIRTNGSPDAVLPQVRRAVQELDPNVPMIDVFSLEEQVALTLKRERMFAWLCGGFGVLALVLAVIGLYGVISYQAARRRNEIGIRIALGATREQVMSLVLGDGLRLTMLGLLVGAPIVYWGSQILEKELFQMKAMDPASLGVAVACLGTAAAIAALIPALRAARVDPNQSLRLDS